MTQVPKEIAAFESGWQSYHLFYHDDLNRPLLECVKPVVVQLHRLGLVRKFFFIRYQLGGPHLRLRVLPEPSCEQKTRDFIRYEVSIFFQQNPSLTTKSEAEIRQANKVLLANDAHETGDEVHPNNSLAEAPFVPEMERYGGSRLLPHSLDFFVFSSIAALGTLKEHNASRSLRIGSAARCLFRLALGFSESLKELEELVSYGMGWGLVNNPKLMLLTDKLYMQQRDKMVRLVFDELSLVTESAIASAAIISPRFWINAAASLAAKLDHTIAPTRRYILESHLHMTANRFGLNNLDEFYLSRLLQRALKDLPQSERMLIERFLSRSQSDAATPTLEQAFRFLDEGSSRNVEQPVREFPVASNAECVYAGRAQKP